MNTLPRMQEAATVQELKDAIALHLNQAIEQVQRLEKVFSTTGINTEAVKCLAMAGIIDEGEGIIRFANDAFSTKRSRVDICRSKAEHY